MALYHDQDVQLNDQERGDLVAFMETLTGDAKRWNRFRRAGTVSNRCACRARAAPRSVWSVSLAVAVFSNKMDWR
jgi:hypothetical protein